MKTPLQTTLFCTVFLLLSCNNGNNKKTSEITNKNTTEVKAENVKASALTDKLSAETQKYKEDLEYRLKWGLNSAAVISAKKESNQIINVATTFNLERWPLNSVIGGINSGKGNKIVPILESNKNKTLKAQKELIDVGINILEYNDRDGSRVTLTIDKPGETTLRVFDRNGKQTFISNTTLDKTIEKAGENLDVSQRYR